MIYKKFHKKVAIGSGISFVFFALSIVLLLANSTGFFWTPFITLALTFIAVAVTIYNAISDFRDLNNWYEQILDFIYLPLSVTDLNMHWIFINKAVKSIIGVEREEVMGQHCSKWNADICNTEKCGVMLLRKGIGRSYFVNEGVDKNFQDDTTYLYDRKNKKKPIGHLELVSDITTKVRLKSAVSRLKSSSQALASTMDQEAAATAEVSATVEEFSKNLESITRNTQKQFTLIEEIVSAIEEMAASIDSVSKNAGGVATKSKDNVNVAEKGQSTISNSFEGIKTLNTSLLDISDKIQQLDTKTQKVDEILQVINGIAAQTNLLSMNAAIESAHAGESGKGFGVVAGEIRKLAESSQTSSKEIAQILDTIKNEMKNIIESSTGNKKLVETNINTISTSLDTLKQIIENVTLIDGMIEEIDRITEDQTSVTSSVLENTKGLKSISYELKDSVSEQSLGINQILEALQSLASSSNETAAEAKMLKNTADELDLGEDE
jgi:methyl-accepting chemotaxis protein